MRRHRLSPCASLLVLFRALLLLLRVLRVLRVAQVRVQAIKARLPDMAVGLQPCVEFMERLRAQLVDALLGDRMRLNNSGIAEHAEMFRHLRLMESESLGDFSDRARPITQEFDNV